MRRARYPDEEGFVERDGVRVAWELYEGPEPTVLFVPQPTLTHARGLKNQIPYVSRHFRTLVVDGRGNGRSDRPPEPAAYLPDEHVGDCLAAMEAHRIERAITISFSSRAIVGLKLCAEHRQRVLAGVFVTPDLWPTSFYLEPLAKGPQEEYAETDLFNLHLMRADWPGFVERWSRVLFPRPHSTRQIEDAVDHALDTDGESFVASIVGSGLPSREAALELARRIECPALVMANGYGSLGPPEASAALAELPGWKVHVFDGLGPLVSARWPVAFNIALREFLESIREATAVTPERAVMSG